MDSKDSVQDALETWQTYVPERPLHNTSTQRSVFQQQQKKQQPVSVETSTAPTRIHSLQDEIWKSTQKASVRIVKRSSEASIVTAPGKGAADASTARVAVDHAPQDQVAEIQPLEDVPRRDNDLELFAMEMERRPLRPSNELILELPPAVETLAYCSQFKHSTMPWFVGGQKTIAANPDIGPPVIPLYTRAYLQPFMREPDPRTTHERPCFNGEQCIARRLSEQRLGIGQGFCLRELLNVTQCTQINAALAHRGGTRPADPTQFLSKIPEMCVMCHVWKVTEAALDQKDSNDEAVCVLNRFMVDIDKPGEYSRHCLLAGDAVAMGIWGPFPLWNERHYVLWKDPKGTGLRGFQELEDMLFRLTLDPSSQPSTRTSATAAASKSLH